MNQKREHKLRMSLARIVFAFAFNGVAISSFAQIEAPHSEELIEISVDPSSKVTPEVIGENPLQLQAKSEEENYTGRRNRKRKNPKSIIYGIYLFTEIHGPVGYEQDQQVKNFTGNITEHWESYFPVDSSGRVIPTSNWPINELIQAARDYSYNLDWQRTYFIEGLMEFASFSTISEHDLSIKTAKAIESFSQNEDDKMALLTVFSETLYGVYNDKRNVFANKNGDAIARGNLSLNQMMTAAANRNYDQSGVCNDIVKAVAMVGSDLFPDKDVLAISNGSHFGVLVHDANKGNTIINWDLRTKVGGEPMLDPDIPVGNTRVFQVHGDKMVEIALLDTETGAVVKKLLNTQTPTLMTGTLPSVIFADFKREVGKEKFARDQEVKVGTAETSHSKMEFVTVENSRNTENASSNTGIFAAREKINIGPNENLLLALHTGRQQNLVKYKFRNLSFVGSVGAEFDAFAAFRTAWDNTNEMNDIPPFSASLNLNQKIVIQNQPLKQSAVAFRFEGQVVQATGSKDEGARQGALSDPNPADAILHSAHYTGFYLNEVNVTTQIQVPLFQNVNAQGVGQYQGSNIGQKVSSNFGIAVTTPKGIKYYAFAGYLDDQLHGYLTKSSLFKNNSGGLFGIQVQGVKGANFSASAERLFSGNAPRVNVTAGIPVLRRHKK